MFDLGYTKQQMAATLSVSTKTIQRDLTKMRKIQWSTGTSVRHIHPKARRGTSHNRIKATPAALNRNAGSQITESSAESQFPQIFASPDAKLGSASAAAQQPDRRREFPRRTPPGTLPAAGREFPATMPQTAQRKGATPNSSRGNLSPG